MTLISLDNYQIQEQIGEGGMAKVFRARRLADDTLVAIKVISEKLKLSYESIKRFEREAKLMLSFDHPHILPVYELLERDGGLFIVMKLIIGGSLRDYIQHHKPTLPELVTLLEKIGDALDYAHARQIVHRDLKPANVMMDGMGDPFLGDFGIAKFKEESVSLTASGEIVGTPSYMAPEQWRSEPLDNRTDIYALGVMVFELLTGQLPFKAETPFSIMYLHLDAPPPSVQSIRPDLPPTLDRVIRRAMAKNPELRYASASHLTGSLREALEQAVQRDPTDATLQLQDFPTPATLTEDDQTLVLHPNKTPATALEDHPTTVGNLIYTDDTNILLENEIANYNAVDVGVKSLLERAAEAVRELQGEEHDLAQAVVTYVQQLRELAKQKPTVDQSPYKALESYDIGDNKLFFGRETAIEEMLARSPYARLTVLHAESGAGKTSLLRAGLMPRLLAGGYLPLYVAVRRRAPHTALKSLLMSDSPFDDKSLRYYLQLLAQVVGANREIFIFIDQFETFFTDVFTDAERADFVQELAECLDDSLLRIRVTLAMRTEYFGLLASFQPQVSQPFAHEFLLRTLNIAEAKRALVLPAYAQGYTYEDEVVEAVMADLTDASQHIAPPQLQLVGGALVDLLSPDRRIITVADYQQAGRAQGVLQGYLERILGRFPTQERQSARLVIEGLVRGDQTRDVRTRTSLQGELESVGAAVGSLDNVLLTLRENHILRVVELEGDLAYELVHDYLALQVQLDPETAARKAAQELLDRRVRDYENYGSLLTEPEYRIITLQQARLLVAGSATKLIAETRQARQRRRRTAILLGAAAVLGIIGTIAIGMFSLIQENQNRQEQLEAAQTSEARITDQRDRANSGQVALQALLEMDENRLDTALLLSVESRHIDDTREARSSLLTILQNIPQLHTMLYEHTEWVRSVAYRPDGGQFASADADGSLILWDAATNTPIGDPLWAHEGGIWSIAYSPNGQSLISGGEDGTLRLWNLADGTSQLLGEFPDDVFSVAFSPDGQLIASGHGDNLIRLWEAATGNLLYELPGHTDWVSALAFSADGRMLASGSWDNTIKIWLLAAGKAATESVTLQGHTDAVLAVEFSPDSLTLASGGADNTLRLWDIEAGREFNQPLTDHTGWVRTVRYSPDGSMIASGSMDRSIILRDGFTGQRLADVVPLIGHAEEVHSLAFSPDGHWLISGAEDGLVLVWDVTQHQPLSRVLGSHAGRVYDVAFSADGAKLLSGSGDSTVQLWDVTTGSAEALPVASGEVLTTALYDSIAAYGDSRGNLYLWQAGILKQTIIAHAAKPLRSLAFSPDGSVIATGGEDGLIKIWEVATGTQVGNSWSGNTDWVVSLAFSPDGKILASGAQDRQIMLWDVAVGQPIMTLPFTHTDAITSVVFSHDGRWLASASRDHTLLLWDLQAEILTGLPLIGHTEWVFDVVFSPDDTLLASASQDKTLILWDVATRQSIGQPLVGHTDWVLSVAFSPDSKTLASGSADNSIRLWDINPTAWENRACQIANRTLQPAERERFLPALSGTLEKTNPCLPL